MIDLKLKIGDVSMIKRHKTEGARKRFTDDLYKIIFEASDLPWALIGYLVASTADSILVDYADIQDGIDFKAGFEQYAKENHAFLSKEDWKAAQS